MAKQLLQVLGYFLVVDLKTIKTNAIWDNPVIKSDVKLMEHLCGPDIPTIKGKTTRHQLVSDVVSILMNYMMHNVMYASILT